MDGILNIHKLAGMTSFDVIAKLRRILNIKKIGHAGTLDPGVSGVLPVCVGKATKVIEFLMDKEKSYQVGLKLGISTDTQDATGTVIDEKPVAVALEEIDRAIKSFLGDSMQIPPMYSAVQINGKRLYDLARQGISVERKARPIHLSAINNILVDMDSHSATFDVNCSRGTYIRTLCQDIGDKLGCGGHMAWLVRTASGPFDLEHAITLAQVEELYKQGLLTHHLYSMDYVLKHFPSLQLSHEERQKLRNGVSIHVESGCSEGLARLYGPDDEFLGIGSIKSSSQGFQVKSEKWMATS